ncbi:MAG: HD domain-containing protein [Georgenia sp.]
MGVADGPQWLCAAYTRSVLAVGGTAPREEIAEVCGRLLDRWQEPDRHFHNIKHLVDLLARVDELSQETHDPDAVRLAAWYHGAIFNSAVSKVYARSGGEDEVASAELASAELTALGVPAATVARIAEMITNLRRHDADVRDIDCLALCDADLGILAVEPQRYRSYRVAVRAEYAQIPDRHYLEARAAIVGKLLARRNIFLSPMGARWEDRARENLRAELDRLEADFAALGTTDPADSVIAAEAAQGEPVVEKTPREFTEPGTGSFPAVAALEPAEDAGPSIARTDRPLHIDGPEPATRPSRTEGPGTARPAPAAGNAARPVPTEGTSARPAPAEGTPATAGEGRDAGVDAPPTSRPSSLEATPDDFAGLGRAPARDREHTAQSAREAIGAAVQHGRERAVQERLQREHLDAVRAEREQATAAFRERRRTDGAASPRSAQTPAEAEPVPTREPAPDLEEQAVPPAPADAHGPESSPEPESSPQHGIEREPEYFDFPRRKHKDH